MKKMVRLKRVLLFPGRGSAWIESVADTLDGMYEPGDDLDSWFDADAAVRPGDEVGFWVEGRGPKGLALGYRIGAGEEPAGEWQASGAFTLWVEEAHVVDGVVRVFLYVGTPRSYHEGVGYDQSVCLVYGADGCGIQKALEDSSI